MKKQLYIYGASDDLIIVDSNFGFSDELECYRFSDYEVMEMGFSGTFDGKWEFKVNDEGEWGVKTLNANDDILICTEK